MDKRGSLSPKTGDYRTGLLTDISGLINEESFVSRSGDGQERHFSKNRKLPFESLTVMLLRGVRSSLQRESDSFFKTVLSTGYNIRSVTKGALSRSRSRRHSKRSTMWPVQVFIRTRHIFHLPFLSAKQA